MEAIFFALYGVRSTGINSDYIVSSFASPKEKCEIRLDFRIGGDNYTVKRTFKKGKTVQHDASFFKDGRERAKGVSDVEAEVKRTIGMGPVDFRNTIYAAQKDLLTLLDADAGKRKEWFLRALGIDYLNTESQKILKEQIEGKAGELQKMTGQLEALAGRQSEEELANLQASVVGFQAAIVEHTKKHDLLMAKKKGLDADLKSLTDKKLAYNRLLGDQQSLRTEREKEAAQIKKLEGLLGLIAEEEAEYHRIEKMAGSYAAVRANLDALQKKKAEYARLGQELGFAKREIGDLNTRIEQQQEQIKALDADEQKKDELVVKVQKVLCAGEIAPDYLEQSVSFRLADINKQSGMLTTRLARYKEEREKIAADQRTIQSAGVDGICPLCRQKLGVHFGDIDAEFNAKLQELADKAVADLEQQEKLGKEKNSIDALRPLLDSIRVLDGKLRQRPVILEEISNLESKLATRKEAQQVTYDSIEKLGYNDAVFLACEKETAEVQKVQLRYSELGKKIGEAGTIRLQLADLATKITERDAGLVRLAEEIMAAAFNPDEIVKCEAAVQEIDRALRDVEVAIEGANKDLHFTKRQIAEYRMAETQIKALRKQTDVLRDEIELLKLTRTLIAEYVVYLMQVVRSRLEGEVSRIISEITGGRYEQVLLDENFNLLVRDVDDDYAIDRFSGGEQDDIAVALRIALSRYLAELHQVHESTFLIFDEIFGSQDEERRNNLLTALRTQESRFPQILLISHIAEIQGEFANTLMVEMGTDQSSKVNVVE